MTTSRPGPARRIVELLETLEPEERREITAWLLRQGRGPVMEFTTAQGSASVGSVPSQIVELRRQLASALPAGEDNQLVTIRLPTDQHAHLRTWCTEHGFTMAAVVRGLVERFLEAQGGGQVRPTTAG